MLKIPKNNIFLVLIGILLLVIGIMTACLFFSLPNIEKNRNVNVDNKIIEEQTYVETVEKKIPIFTTIPKETIKIIEKPTYIDRETIKEVEKPVEVIKYINKCDKCDAAKTQQTPTTTTTTLTTTSQPASHIQEINGVKHHHYIVPNSELDDEYAQIKHNCKKLFELNLQPTLMHQFIKKLNPDYKGWICLTPSFNENDTNIKIMTEIKDPPFDLVGIYFDKGTRFGGIDDSTDWDKYTFDEVVKETNGSENVYYFWRTKEMYNIFKKNIYILREKTNPNNPKSNEPHCPSFAKVLTQEDIDNL